MDVSPVVDQNMCFVSTPASHDHSADCSSIGNDTLDDSDRQSSESNDHTNILQHSDTLDPVAAIPPLASLYSAPDSAPSSEKDQAYTLDHHVQSQDIKVAVINSTNPTTAQSRYKVPVSAELQAVQDSRDSTKASIRELMEYLISQPGALGFGSCPAPDAPT